MDYSIIVHQLSDEPLIKDFIKSIMSPNEEEQNEEQLSVIDASQLVALMEKFFTTKVRGLRFPAVPEDTAGILRFQAQILHKKYDFYRYMNIIILLKSSIEKINDLSDIMSHAQSNEEDILTPTVQYLKGILEYPSIAVYLTNKLHNQAILEIVRYWLQAQRDFELGLAVEEDMFQQIQQMLEEIRVSYAKNTSVQTHVFKQELMAVAWSPERVMAIVSQGIEPSDM